MDPDTPIDDQAETYIHELLARVYQEAVHGADYPILTRPGQISKQPRKNTTASSSRRSRKKEGGRASHLSKGGKRA